MPRKLGVRIAIGLSIILGAIGIAIFLRAGRTWQVRRALHETKLLRRGKSPQDWKDEKPRAGVQEMKLASGALELKAWFARPLAKEGERVPAVAYFHGGFAFGADDWEEARAFHEAGFALLCPTVRGENGNPGDFELFYGEVDDARAAVRWLAQQPGIDPERIFTFGHSVGGGISSLLALHDEPKVRLSGSAGGLYPPGIFAGWRQICPFDPFDVNEIKLRLLSVNLDQMRGRHVAYIGTEDDALARDLPLIREAARKCSAPLEVERVPGDHGAMLEPAISKFIERAKKER